MSYFFLVLKKLLFEKINFLLCFLFSFYFTFGQNVDSIKLANKPLKISEKQLVTPISLMVLGVLADGGFKQNVKGFRDKNLQNFYTKTDDFLQFAPHVSVYAFEWAGMKPRTDIRNRTAIFIKGELLTLGLTYILKNSLKAVRPDGTSLSFPSGHTAFAFSGATMLSMEYGENYKWVPYVAYGTAATVGAMRIANNRHYISDVLFGAGLGILSIKASYWTHQYKWTKKKSESDPFVALYSIENQQD